MGVQLFAKKSYENNNKTKTDEMRQIHYKLDYLISLVNTMIGKIGRH